MLDQGFKAVVSRETLSKQILGKVNDNCVVSVVYSTFGIGMPFVSAITITKNACEMKIWLGSVWAERFVSSENAFRNIESYAEVLSLVDNFLHRATI